MSALNPVLVTACRGDLIENRHRGSFVVVNADGDLITAAGNFRQLIYPRSSLKPLQVLAMLESGAAEAFGVSDQEVAIACASHNGEAQHVSVVKNWLNRLELTEENLDCGVHSPMGRDVASQLLKDGQIPTTLHNACSGKHTGFLTLTKYLQAPVAGYTRYSHPAQQYISRLVSLMCNFDLETAPKGIDGCNVPVLGMQLIQLAQGMAQLVQPKNLPINLQSECYRVIKAIQENPTLIAGTGRICTDIIEKTKGNVVIKMGADGVFSGCLTNKGLGIALKIDDGNLKAAEVAITNLLKLIDALPSDVDFSKWMNPVISNWHKTPVGEMRAMFADI